MERELEARSGGAAPALRVAADEIELQQHLRSLAELDPPAELVARVRAAIGLADLALAGRSPFN